MSEANGSDFLRGEELVDRAFDRYFKRGRSLPGQTLQPSRAMSTVEGDLVVLRNVNGVLAVYELKGDRLIDITDQLDEEELERLAEA